MNDSVSNDTNCILQGTENTDKISSLLTDLNAYLLICHSLNEEKKNRKTDVFPNLAGFCRYLGCGITDLEGLRLSNPTLYDQICVILEDEALNSEISPTILTSYLKKRLGYSEKSEASASADCGQIRLVFEHDVMEDGS